MKLSDIISKKNIPWEVTDQDGNKKTIWESRSMVSAVFVFTQDKEGYWRVLAIKRGSGCPDGVGSWVCPCGYLDYGESLRLAAYRECHEETGVHLRSDDIRLYSISDHHITDEKQNVVAIHYTVVNNGFDYAFTTKYSEPNEVDEIAWVRIDLLDNFNWAFGHKDIIMDIWNNRIFIPWWKKLLIKMYRKYILL